MQVCNEFQSRELTHASGADVNLRLDRKMSMLHTIGHGMLLDGKSVMDNALPELGKIRKLIPEVLHEEFEKIIASFEDDLAQCDVKDDYTEKPRREGGDDGMPMRSLQKLLQAPGRMVQARRGCQSGCFSQHERSGVLQAAPRR